MSNATYCQISGSGRNVQLVNYYSINLIHLSPSAGSITGTSLWMMMIWWDSE